MIARAAAMLPFLPRQLSIVESVASIFSIGIATPMRPVEQTSTCLALSPSAFPAAAHIRLACCNPGTPVQALALPLLATIARTSEDARFARETRTGAAFTLFVVNVPAAAVLCWEKISAISGADLFAALMPQNVLPATKPCGAVMPPGISV